MFGVVSPVSLVVIWREISGYIRGRCSANRARPPTVAKICSGVGNVGDVSNTSSGISSASSVSTEKVWIEERLTAIQYLSILLPFCQSHRSRSSNVTSFKRFYNVYTSGKLLWSNEAFKIWVHTSLVILKTSLEVETEVQYMLTLWKTTHL